MIRRYETYAFLPNTSPEAQRRLADVLGHCHRHIPEVLYNAVGWNRSDAPAELVWEHAYASVEAYHRYMVHPYHADLIDRYVLPDSPERVVEPVTGAGLFGYHCEEPSFLLAPRQARRVVLLRFKDPRPGRDIGVVAADFELKARQASSTTGAIASAFGPNTLANSWFDGVTPHGPPPKWSHVWEQGFADFASLELRAPRTGAGFLRDAEVEQWTELRYEVLA